MLGFFVAGSDGSVFAKVRGFFSPTPFALFAGFFAEAALAFAPTSLGFAVLMDAFLGAVTVSTLGSAGFSVLFFESVFVAFFVEAVGSDPWSFFALGVAFDFVSVANAFSVCGSGGGGLAVSATVSGVFLDLIAGAASEVVTSAVIGSTTFFF